ncbi:hypothetical protein [Rhodococcus erythropolis]|jgi:hypothetical protein|uniref:hypothetical protein n=1 Tax=Rhodococcus erythropolis TaxID=1833 RepID=UPI0018A2D74F|nr:hypothetical protein [Rhodococcus erythropolis]MBF7736712.1 hypothetical protein [Rhodococcus erythropolis]MCZ4644064.1 hypothetical protein [Rhodococcus erythropolis]
MTKQWKISPFRPSRPSHHVMIDLQLTPSGNLSDLSMDGRLTGHFVVIWDWSGDFVDTGWCVEASPIAAPPFDNLPASPQSEDPVTADNDVKIELQWCSDGTKTAHYPGDFTASVIAFSGPVDPYQQVVVGG